MTCLKYSFFEPFPRVGFWKSQAKTQEIIQAKPRAKLKLFPIESAPQDVLMITGTSEAAGVSTTTGTSEAAEM